jgi:hypothetical protein
VFLLHLAATQDAEVLSVDEVAYQSIDNGLLAFTAPWCPHCRS